MPLAGPINDAHPAAPDFFKDLIIAYAPIGVTYIKFPEYVIKRFFRRRSFQLRTVSFGTHALSKHAAQAKTATHA
jgi:hypothetical protein